MAFSTYIRSVHAWLRKRKYRCKENAQKAEFQIRKKNILTDVFESLTAKMHRLYFFHLFIFWSTEQNIALSERELAVLLTKEITP